MTAVRIGQLKAHLSRFLRAVRRGDEVVVLDRDEPIARIVAYRDDGGVLEVRQPAKDSPRLGQVRLPPPSKTKGDPVSVLLEDRAGRL